VRCQAGLNRSGLVTALILMKEGFTAQDAINLIRSKRHEDALFNDSFANWLLTSGAELIFPSSELSA
jgi:protein-tyrosine phosphatase